MSFKKCNGKGCILDHVAMCARYDKDASDTLKNKAYVICAHFVTSKTKTRR